MSIHGVMRSTAQRSPPVTPSFDFMSSFSALLREEILLISVQNVLNFKTGLLIKKLTENFEKIAKFAENSIL